MAPPRPPPSSEALQEKHGLGLSSLLFLICFQPHAMGFETVFNNINGKQMNALSNSVDHSVKTIHFVVDCFHSIFFAHINW